MKNDSKILKRTSAKDFTSGIPNKKDPKDSLMNKAYSLGYQQASLMNGIQAFQTQQAQAQQDMAMATQQLLQLQAQIAEEKAKAAAAKQEQPPMLPAQAALNAGPMPGAPPMGAPPMDMSAMMPPAVPPMAPGAPSPMPTAARRCSMALRRG